MSYKLPPVSRCQISDSTIQVITDATLAYPVLFDTNDDVVGITHDVTGSTVTISISNPGVVTWTGHTFVAGDCVKFTTTGALPTGITAGTAYFVVNPQLNTFNIAAKPGGTAINTTGTQNGVHTAKSTHRIYFPSTGDWLVIYSIITNGSLGDHISIWGRLDDVNIPRSNTISEITKNGGEILLSCSFIVTTTTQNQKFELMWAGDSTNCQLLATRALTGPVRPACPSTLLTINKISK